MIGQFPAQMITRLPCARPDNQGVQYIKSGGLKFHYRVAASANACSGGRHAGVPREEVF
jgi:hypothetical protein